MAIAVENIKEHMKEVEKRAAKAPGEPMEIAEVGLYVSFMDTEDNGANVLKQRQ